MGPFKAFLVDFIGNLVKCGGETVNADHEKARRQICEGCDRAGTVILPIPLITVKARGCTECGCPFKTKCKTLTHCNFAEGKPLERVVTTCPHPDGNKWIEVDNNFVMIKK